MVEWGGRRVFGMVEIDSGKWGEGLQQREDAARLIVEVALKIPVESSLGEKARAEEIPMEAVVAGNRPEAPLEAQIATAWYVAKRAVGVLRDGASFNREEGLQLERGSLATEVASQVVERMVGQGRAEEPYQAWEKLDKDAGVITPLSGGLTGREFRNRVNILTQADASAGAQALMNEIKSALELTRDRQLSGRALDMVEDAVLRHYDDLNAREEGPVKATLDQAIEDVAGARAIGAARPAAQPAVGGGKEGGHTKGYVLERVTKGEELFLDDPKKGDLRAPELQALPEAEKDFVDAAVILASAVAQKGKFGSQGGVPDEAKQQGEPRISELEKKHLQAMLSNKQFVAVAKRYLEDILLHREVDVPDPGQGEREKVRLREATSDELKKIREARRNVMTQRGNYISQLVEATAWNLIIAMDIIEDSTTPVEEVDVKDKESGKIGKRLATPRFEIAAKLLESCRQGDDPEVLDVPGNLGVSRVDLTDNKYDRLRDILAKVVLGDASSVGLLKYFHPMTVFWHYRTRMGGVVDWYNAHSNWGVDSQGNINREGLARLRIEMEKCYPKDTGECLMLLTELPTTKEKPLKRNEFEEKSLVEIILGGVSGDYEVNWNAVKTKNPISLRVKKAQIALVDLLSAQDKEFNQSQADIQEKVLNHRWWGRRVRDKMNKAFSAAGVELTDEWAMMILRVQFMRSERDTLDVSFIDQVGIFNHATRLANRLFLSFMEVGSFGIADPDLEKFMRGFNWKPGKAWIA
jgi:hypothetical protein